MSSVQDSRSPLDEFLNPKSMLTPGVAGAVTMLITNTLTVQFGLVPNVTGLVLSFLLGSVVFLSQSDVRWPGRVLYYILNSLIIFSVAMGTNQAGVSASQKANTRVVQAAPGAMAASEPFFSDWLDGTVPLRRQVGSEIATRVGPEQARRALTLLGAPPTSADPVKELKSRVEVARSANEIEQVQMAVAASPPPEPNAPTIDAVPQPPPATASPR